MTLATEERSHAYDPVRDSAYFEGVLGRRIAAFLIDVVFIFLLSIAVYALLFIAGIFTFGLPGSCSASPFPPWR